MTTTAPRFVLDAHSAAATLLDGPDGYDCFVVDLDRAYARRLLRLIRLVRTLEQRLPEVYRLELWDGHGDYYAVDYEAETLPTGMIPGEAAKNSHLVPTGEPSRIECARLMVLPDGVHWAAYPKHSDFELETETLPWEQIEAVAARPNGKAKGRKGSGRG